MKTCYVYEKGNFGPIKIDNFISVSMGLYMAKFNGLYKTVVIRTDNIEKYIINKKGDIIDGEA